MHQGRTAATTALADLGLMAVAPVEPAPVRSYSTYVHATKLTTLGWPHLGATEHPLLGRPGDPRFAVALTDHHDHIIAAIGVGGARAVNQLRPLIERRAPASDLPAAATSVRP